jgi:hypothetical protein
MSKLTKSYKSNFTTVPNIIINDKTISLKAKGIYLFLISKPDNWVFSVDRIASQNSDGENSVRTALKELETKRFLKRVQINKGGIFGQNDYIIYDEPYPLDENHLTVISTPSDDSRRTVSRRAENHRALVKTNIVKVINSKELITPLPNDVAFLFTKDGGDLLYKYLDFRKSKHDVKNPIALSRSVVKNLKNNDDSERFIFRCFNFYTCDSNGIILLDSFCKFLGIRTLGFKLPYSEYLELLSDFRNTLDLEEFCSDDGLYLLDIAIYNLSFYPNFMGVYNV